RTAADRPGAADQAPPAAAPRRTGLLRGRGPGTARSRTAAADRPGLVAGSGEVGPSSHRPTRPAPATVGALLDGTGFFRLRTQPALQPHGDGPAWGREAGSARQPEPVRRPPAA